MQVTAHLGCICTQHCQPAPTSVLKLKLNITTYVHKTPALHTGTGRETTQAKLMIERESNPLKKALDQLFG